MDKKKKDQAYKDAPELHEAASEAEVATEDVYGDDGTEDFEATEAEAAAVDMAAELTQAREEIVKQKNDYLYLMAEFDNFRKRVVREKADLVKNAAEKVLLGLLPIVDDFERGLDASRDTDNAEAIRQGMELIYNKLVRYLESNGVKAMESTGTTFDAEVHEAIATIPAPAEDLKGKVIDTTQKGYMLNDKVLRHAKVVVGE